MLKNISEARKDLYAKHNLDSSTIYTDQYGKTIIEEEAVATVIYNHHSNFADIYCNKCGEYIGNANCTTNSFWNFVHDEVNVHKCRISD